MSTTPPSHAASPEPQDLVAVPPVLEAGHAHNDQDPTPDPEPGCLHTDIELQNIALYVEASHAHADQELTAPPHALEVGHVHAVHDPALGLEAVGTQTQNLDPNNLANIVRLLSTSVQLLHSSVEALKQLKESSKVGLDARYEEPTPQRQIPEENDALHVAAGPIPLVEVLPPAECQAKLDTFLKSYQLAMQRFSTPCRSTQEDSWRALLSKWDASFDDPLWQWDLHPNDQEQRSRQLQEIKAEIITNFLRNEVLRIQTQKRLLYALSGASQQHSNCPARQCLTLDVGPWVSLILWKLPRHFFECEHLTSRTPTELLSMLVTTLEAPRPTSYDPIDDGHFGRRGDPEFWGKGANIGQILDEMYRMGIMIQPGGEDFDTYKLHGQEIFMGLELMNIWHPAESFGPYVEDFTRPQEIREVSLATVFWWSFEADETKKLPRHTELSFKSDQLCLRNLRRVGKLRFRWTEYLSEHLVLDTKTSTLFLYWFGFQVENSPLFHIACKEYNYLNCHRGDNNPMAEQVGATYKLIFHSSKEAYTADMREYSLLAIPPWMRVFAGSSKGPLSTRSAPTMSYFLNKGGPFVSDMEYHLSCGRAHVSEFELYEDLSRFEDKIRILMAYMDSQKPGGIRGLWRDRRDNYQWFTFWVVVVFGAVTVVVSFLGLGVAIAQAVAGFKALNLNKSAH